MTIEKIYKQFKHLDPILSDKRFIDGNNPLEFFRYESWQAIKEFIKKDELKKWIEKAEMGKERWKRRE